MTDDPHELGPECDFCGIPVEPDESLEPIYVGELPQPKPHYLSEVSPRPDRGSNNMYLLEKPIGIYDTMYRALHKCRDIEINESMRVKYESAPESTQFETRTHDDKVGVSLKIHPKDVEYEPDAEVCDTCAEMLHSL